MQQVMSHICSELGLFNMNIFRYLFLYCFILIFVNRISTILMYYFYFVMFLRLSYLVDYF